MSQKDSENSQKRGGDRAVSLAPRTPAEAFAGLFAVPNPEAAKPSKRKPK